MGREVRRVPKDWEHPVRADGSYKPLYPGCFMPDAIKEFQDGDRDKAPDPADYMPRWTDAEADHLMMYEDTSEGTPISPAFKTPEELATWLADNKASAFADQTATREEWLDTIRRGFAPTAFFTGVALVSGVRGLK